MAIVAKKIMTATKVAIEDRMDFWRRQYGLSPLAAVRLEAHIYHWAGRFSDDYKGGFWNFFTTSNGGAFVAPDETKPFQVSALNGEYDGPLSAEAFGLVATQMGLAGVLERVVLSGSENPQVESVFDANVDYYLSLDEATAIYRCLD